MFVTVRLTICHSSRLRQHGNIGIHCTHDTNLCDRLYWPQHKYN